MKKALITGITGQDGSYLCEFLLDKGYEIHGMIRRSSSSNTSRIDHLCQNKSIFNKRLFLHYGDLSDSLSISHLIKKIAPDEVYNLAAQSHVKVSFEIPEYTTNIDALGTCVVLNAIRQSGLKIKFYQASSSEMFGKVQSIPQNETTPFYPRSPYGCAKLYSHWITVNFRESYGIFACSGILFNHESPRRGLNFVTRKITRGIAEILAGKVSKIYLGNLDAKRDWGFAGDYVEAMWLMLQQKEAEDFVIATGETHSVREFLEEAFGYAGLEWQRYVEISEKHFRPAEVDLMIGDASKAKTKLGWQPKVKFKELVRMMVDSDRKQLEENKIF